MIESGESHGEASDTLAELIKLWFESGRICVWEVGHEPGEWNTWFGDCCGSQLDGNAVRLHANPAANISNADHLIGVHEHILTCRTEASSNGRDHTCGCSAK